MRALRITRKVLVIVACCLFGVAFVLPAFVESDGLFAALFSSHLGAGIAIVMVVAGSILLFSKNAIARAFAIAFTVSVYAFALLGFLAGGEGLVYLVAFIAAIVYLVSWLFALIVYAVGHAKHDDSDPNSDARIEAILKWRNLLDKKIITEEEFMEKRNHILGIEPKEEPEVK